MSQQISFETFSPNAAENYEHYFVPAIAAPLAADLVDLAKLRRGERVLDVACGTGVVARHALEHVGAGGRVAGVDINPGMLALARAATAAIDWYEAPADQLPLPDETFDVALCQLGLQFFPDKTAALREMRRVLVPGGRLLVSVPWPTPPLFAVMEQALARHLGSDVAGFVRAVFSLHGTRELRDLVSDAGFANVEARSNIKTLRLPARGEFLWQYVHSTPLAAVAAQLDEERRTALEREVVAGWQPLTENGSLILRLDVTVATARR